MHIRVIDESNAVYIYYPKSRIVISNSTAHAWSTIQLLQTRIAEIIREIRGYLTQLHILCKFESANIR